MTSRWLRGTVFAALLIVLASAIVLVLRADRRVRAHADAVMAIDQAARRAVAAAYDVRVCQQGYVAFAQSPEWWHGRLASHVDALRADLGTLRQLATDPGALNDLDAAAASLDAFGQVDERALRMVLTGRDADASLLVFSEGIEAISTVVQRVESARTAESAAAAARSADARRTQEYAAAGAMATAVVAAFLLLVPAQPRPRVAGEPAEEPEAIESTSLQAGPSLSEEAARETLPAGDAAPPVVDRRQATELHATASLCTDLARVVDAHELPGLLARAVDLLEAKGLIVWMADADGSALGPSLAHGYSAAALARLSPIHRDADNATAACFRRAELDAVAGDDTAPGAIVAPLLTAAGCVGVLAVEVLNGREASEPTRAMTRILAAQLSTLVGGGPAREEIAPGHEKVG